MTEYNIERKPADLKDALDFLVHRRLTQELNDSNESINEHSYRIIQMFNDLCKNDDGSINKNNQDAIREIMKNASQLNEYHDSRYRNEECKN